eukprot:10482247-Ditylum_brightwellii.AAC.1
MEGNSITMASSIPAPSVVTISSSPYNNSTDHSMILEMVLDESTIKAAETVAALGSDYKQQKQPNLIFYRQDHPLLPVTSLAILS